MALHPVIVDPMQDINEAQMLRKQLGWCVVISGMESMSDHTD